MNIQNESFVTPMVGELNYTTIPALNKSSRDLINHNAKITFDMSQITNSDNTGVGFLVALTSYAKVKGKVITFINLPKQLLDLIEAVKLKDLLPII